MSPRFTLDGSAALERHLTRICERVLIGVQHLIPSSKLEGLALAGGYGRGEGGVLRTSEGDQPYNDLEFFVFVKGCTWANDRRYKAALHHLGEQLTPKAGIDVEFKIISSAQLRRSATSMFYYDLVMGHRWLCGDDNLLRGCDHHRIAACIPQHEVTRLLFNRCSGLLFAKERLKQATFTAEDADFVGRNIAKAQLALGDAQLASEGRYHWSCLERSRQLESHSPLAKHHAAGVEFKLHPHRSTLAKAELQHLHAQVSEQARQLFLLFESRRLDHIFTSVQDYVSSGINKCPEQPLWKNVLQHLRSGPTALGVPQPIERHPREALLHALALMLWGDDSLSRTRLQAYRTLWHRFN